MLAEALVALIALSTVMILSQGEIKGLKPGSIYGMGIGEFLSSIIGSEHKAFAVTFGAMAFSTFVFDTLDVSTRIGRYLIQELMQWKNELSKYLATFITLAPPALILIAKKGDSWIVFWTIFGTANQLLAALTLLGISLYLARSNKPFLVTLIPVVFLLSVTGVALLDIIIKGVLEQSFFGFVNATVAFLLLCLAFFIVSKGIIKLIDVVSPKARFLLRWRKRN
jgi:carbon starvation protein